MSALDTALAHFTAGNYEMAAATISSLPTAERLTGTAQNLLGVIHARLGRHQEAATAFRSVLATAPDNPRVMANLASSLHKSGLSAEAITVAQQALGLDPSLTLAWNTLGAAYNACGEHAAAEETSRAGIACCGEHAFMLNNLGNALHAQKKLPDAEASFRRALALQESYPECLVNLSTVLQAGGHHDEARLLCERALAIRPGYTEAADALWQVADFWNAPLNGRRLELRRTTPADAEFLRHSLANADFRNRYQRFGNPHTSSASLRSGLALGPWATVVQNRSAEWIIRRRGNDTPLGLAGLADISREHRRAEFLIGLPDAELHGTGIALEASLLVMEFAFQRAGFHKLTSIVYGDNPVAQTNTEALGFRREGFRKSHLRNPSDGSWLDVYENGLTVADFAANERIACLARRQLGREITQTPSKD